MNLGNTLYVSNKPMSTLVYICFQLHIAHTMIKLFQVVLKLQSVLVELILLAFCMALIWFEFMKII